MKIAATAAASEKELGKGYSASSAVCLQLHLNLNRDYCDLAWGRGDEVPLADELLPIIRLVAEGLQVVLL